jgi:hypothetical protein
MEIRNPVLRAQIFEIDPHRLALAPRHRRDVHGRQFTPERLDHDIGDLQDLARVRRLVPVLDHDAGRLLPREGRVDGVAERVKSPQIVDE